MNSTEKMKRGMWIERRGNKPASRLCRVATGELPTLNPFSPKGNAFVGKPGDYVRIAMDVAGGSRYYLNMHGEVAEALLEYLQARHETPARAHLAPVPTPMDVDDAAEAAMAYIDELGAPPLPRPAWIAMLEEIIGQCRTRIELAHEDDKRDK